MDWIHSLRTCLASSKDPRLLSILLMLAPIIAVFSGVAMAPFLMLIIIISLGFYLPQIKQYRPFSPLPIRIMGLFLLWALLSISWTITIDATLSLWLKFMAMLPGSAIALAVYKRAREEGAPNANPYLPVYGLVIALILTAIERATHGAIASSLHRIFPGNAPYSYNITDLNRTATIIALFIWPALWALLQRNQKIAAVLLWLATCALLLTLTSLSATMGISAGSACFMLVYLLRNKAITLVLAMLLMLIATTPAIMLSINPPAVMAHFPSIPESCEHRLYIWDFASHKALEHPWLGWGFNASRHMPILPQEILAKGKSPLPLHPHNSITQLWLELGAPGVLLFAAFIASLCTALMRYSRDRLYQAAAIAAMISYVVIGLTAFGIWQEWWVAVGFLVALSMTPRIGTK